MSLHASDGACELLAGMALGPVHQLSLRLLPAACHLESPGPIAEVRLGRSLNLLPGRQWNEAHLRQATRSVHQGLQERFQCCAPAAHPELMAKILSRDVQNPVPHHHCSEAAQGKEDADMLQSAFAAC